VNPDVGEWLVRVVIAVIVAAGSVFAYRTPRKASPYDSIVKRLVFLEKQREEDFLKTEELQRKVRHLGDERESLHRELEELKQRSLADQTEIAGLKRRVDAVMRDRDNLVAYVKVMQAWIANGAKPPAPTLPNHLADVVPAWVPGDDAERPRPHQEVTD
jgi:hypothetical protein